VFCSPGRRVLTVADTFSSDAIREKFAVAMSAMYMSGVPHYKELAKLVSDVNNDALIRDPKLKEQLSETGEIERLGIERHGAIRVGTAKELSKIRRLFAVMGMEPVGYYDLSVAGIPVHSTAFRPTTDEALRRNPFRIFTSLLRLDLIEDEDARQEAAAILARRNIFTARCLKLLGLCEEKRELNELEADEFVSEAIETFRWRSEAAVSAEAYRRLYSSHPLIADVVCFKGPHINHLTLRTLDIDALQQAMAARSMSPKEIIEGPPRRRCPILLRQTSFKAIQEPVSFKAADGSSVSGVHSARFGEIEQRGAALTARGRALYDRLLAAALSSGPMETYGFNATEHADRLAIAFKDFPDDFTTLRSQELAFFRYSPARKRTGGTDGSPPPFSIDGLVRTGYLQVEPIIYEDFLPVSAAGIFRSNLGVGGQQGSAGQADRKAFEEALGCAVIDELELYAEAEARSRNESLKLLGLGNELKQRGTFR
jgi:uncharacterized glyoxalase superfamily metalloenzyme YdcJ